MATRIVQTPKAQLFDTPLIGDDLAKIGRIIDLWAIPCAPDPQIWVYAFFQEVPTFLTSILKPEIIDVSIRHRGRKPQKGKKYKFHISQIFRDSIIDVPVPRWTVFTLYELTQRVGFYFLLADATENLIINWTSTAYKWNGCVDPELVYCLKYNNRAFAGSSLTPEKRRLVWLTEAVSQITDSATEVRPILPGKYRISYECMFEPYVIPSQSELPIYTGLTINGEWIGETLDPLSFHGPGKGYSSGAVTIYYDGPPAPAIGVSGSWANPQKFCYMTGKWSISRVGIGELEPDP